jgi:hypothetical protein
MDFPCWSFFHYDTREKGKTTQHYYQLSHGSISNTAKAHSITVIFWFPGSSYFDILSTTVSVTFTLHNSKNIYWQLK